MKESVTIVHNAVIARVLEPSSDLKLWLDGQLSYEVAGAQHMGASNKWNGRSSFFKPSTGKFPAGFVRLIRKRLEREGHAVTVHSKPAPEPIGPESPKVNNFPADPRYDYQEETMRRLVSLRGMIAQVATGGGKSNIFKLCAERIGRPTLFVTTRKSLMYQMAEDYERTIGKPHGLLGDSKWQLQPKGVNFAIINTLALRLETMTVRDQAEKELERQVDAREKKISEVMKKSGISDIKGTNMKLPADMASKADKIRAAVIDRIPIDVANIAKQVEPKVKKHMRKREELLKFLAGIEFVCLEEAHEVSSNSYYSVMNACENAHYRLALTATPFMKDDEEANMRLMATTGPIGIRVTEKLLIDRGILAKPYFIYEGLSRPNALFRSTPWQAAFKSGVVENKERNQKIITHCVKARRYGLPVMVLVTQMAHGRSLLSSLEALNINAQFISGESNQVIRQKALNELGSGHIDVLIGSTILDVGVDVPAVGLVILAGGGKAEVSLRQRIGRGLREKKSGPNIAFIVDFEDAHNKHLAKHYRMRREVVETTPGFAENILESFDYRQFGLQEVA